MSSVSHRIARVLALWFGCGLIPRLPGTAGTLGALPLYLLVAPGGVAAVLAAAAVVAALGIWASAIVERQTGRKDAQEICIDEVAGVLVTLAAAPATAPGIAAAVILFRIADVVKPFPARLAQDRLPGGWGVVTDDLVAGAWAAIAILAGRQLGWL